MLVLVINASFKLTLFRRNAAIHFFSLFAVRKLHVRSLVVVVKLSRV